MAEWTQLPIDLLNLIAQRLGSSSDILRFRSVCSTFRSSVSPKPRRLPNRVRIQPNDGISNNNNWGFYLSKRTIFRLALPENFENPQFPREPNSSWIVKIEEDVPNRTHLMNPLSGVEFKPVSVSFPKILDLLEFRVWELGQEFVLQYINYRPNANSVVDAGSLYTEKVVFCPIDSGNGDGFVILTIHVSGKLAILRSGEKKWRIIEDMPYPYDDVMLYRGELFAVDGTGRTVVVDLLGYVSLVSNYCVGGDKKYLVESNDELLLVDKYFSADTEDGLENNEEVNILIISERVIRFKVYKLNVGDKNWVGVENLGDRLLFLGENSTFSASASDFVGCRGNCIYFMDSTLCSNMEEDGLFGIGVFDLENGSIGPLTCSKMFWPPPSWITSTIMDVNQFGDMSI